MDQKTDSHSFPGFHPWNTEHFDVKKKRKLLIDQQLELPKPKLPCWGSTSISLPYRDTKLNLNKKPQEEEEEEEAIDEVNEIKPKEELRMQGEKDELLQSYYGHEEDLLEFGSHENCNIDRAQSLLLPKHSNQDFVLSSGRWNIDDPEAESKTVKPSIDQEFEHYFSVLMPSLDP